MEISARCKVQLTSICVINEIRLFHFLRSSRTLSVAGARAQGGFVFLKLLLPPVPSGSQSAEPMALLEGRRGEAAGLVDGLHLPRGGDGHPGELSCLPGPCPRSRGAWVDRCHPCHWQEAAGEAAASGGTCSCCKQQLPSLWLHNTVCILFPIWILLSVRLHRCGEGWHRGIPRR